MISSSLISRLSVVLVLPVLIFFAACETVDPHDDDHDHEDAQRVLIETRVAGGELIGEWSEGHGWTDADGNSIDELATPVHTEAGDLEPLRVGGPNASLSVTFVNPDGSEIHMETIDRDDHTRERVCSEYSARYYLTPDDTNVLAWPNIPHPESDRSNPPHQFAERDTGEVVGIFHCDHIHFYPENAGSVDVQFALWHNNHDDGLTDLITLRVEEQ